MAANRDLRLLRAAFNWAIRTGYVEHTPFKRGTVTAVALTKDCPIFAGGGSVDVYEAIEM